jgi:cation transport ATPase
MALSVLGMLVAAAGYLPPVAGAIAQEVIDVVVVVNALRVGIRPKSLTDYQAS